MRGNMRTREMHILIFWFVTGWLFAAVAANRLFAAGLVDADFLCQGLAEGPPAQTALRALRVLTVRLAEFGLLTAACHGRAKMAVARAAAALQGVSIAFSLVLFTWGFGWYGLFRFLAASFPHEMFYLALMTGILAGVAFHRSIYAQKFRIAGLIFLISGILSEILL